jgi:hypothetical protein
LKRKKAQVGCTGKMFDGLTEHMVVVRLKTVVMLIVKTENDTIGEISVMRVDEERM